MISHNVGDSDNEYYAKTKTNALIDYDDDDGNNDGDNDGDDDGDDDDDDDDDNDDDNDDDDVKYLTKECIVIELH